MEKVIKSLIVTFMVILIIAVSMPKSNAAGLTISFSKSSANVGESVTVTVNGTGIAGKIALSVSGNATVTPSNVWVDNSSATATVKVNGTGSIKVTATPVDASDSTTANPFTTATAGTISVATSGTNNSNQSNNSNSGSNSNASSTTQQQTKSNVATLANLGIKGQYDFTGFKATKTSYSVTVPNEAESVEIYATKGQSGQKITGTGVKQLNEGANTVNVVVTAEDGKTTKTYTINIERKASEETTETPGESSEETSTEEESFGLKELKIEGIEITPEFKTNIYTYTAELKDDKTSLELTTIPTEENAEIEVTGNEDLKDGENLITVIVKEKDTDKTATYQITVNKISNEQNTTEATVNKLQLSKKKIIILGAGIVVLLLIIIVVIFIIKRRKNANNNGEYYYSELYGNDDKEENLQEQIEEDYDEQPKKKKHSKGKRFK